MTEGSQWCRCSACKKPIPFASGYWVCNVSTCNRKRTGLVFCSVDCWEVHLPTANHRESWALERTAPTGAEYARSAVDVKEKKTVRRRQVRPDSTRSASAPPTEVLIVASRLKEFVRGHSGFSTSDRVLEPLSEIVRRVCEKAIRNAAREGRRTILGRDIPRS